MLERADGRNLDQLRPVSFKRNFTPYAEGSVLVTFGATKVICTASIEDSVPAFLKGQGRGWLTAEYAMLPRATHTRNKREISQGKPNPRNQEIQRLIGRSLRSIIDFNLLGERQIIIDCDVIQADGGTRTASISGAYVALHDAISQLIQQKVLLVNPLQHALAAVSVGIYRGTPILDLDYNEDSQCETDLNLVMTASGGMVEIQGTAEKHPFSSQQLQEMLRLGQQGIQQILAIQQQVLQ